jgi:hypothetical protein
MRGREQTTGQRSSFPIGGHRSSRIAAMEPVLPGWIEQAPGLSLAELCERLAEQGVAIKIGALWQQALPTMEVEMLVFIDETWISTSMARPYGCAPRGQRFLGSAPHGHWETTTFVGALRRRRLTAPMVTDGPMDGETFLAYVHQFLCPTLEPGDTVVL